MQSPYRRQKRHHFWKGVGSASVDAIDLAHLYQKKFSIGLDQGARIATAGSCFAQNIRRELIARDCNFYDAEPAPQMLPAARRHDFGYDLFSARFGNIYTVAQLRQLAERAYGHLPGADACWHTDGRYFDPFRPTIETGGFISAEEVENARISHLRAVRTLFEKADVLIFTLGLTEAWRDAETGIVFPMCPGTAAGEFDASRHEFVNYDVADIVRDFEAFMAIVHGVNPSMKFFLTVSPVPLVATATPHHVINATSYSKAVLRAAAGKLYDLHDTVDYFPSYEVFTSPVFEGCYFEADKRSPSQAGIDRAMSVFFGQHGERGAKPEPDEEELARETIRQRVEAARARQQELCDEMML